MKSIREVKDHIVVEFFNEENEKYEIGYPKEAGDAIENLELSFKENKKEIFKASYSKMIDLDCPPDGHRTVSYDNIKIGSKEAYVISDTRATVYSYQLNFKNSKGLYITFQR